MWKRRQPSLPPSPLDKETVDGMIRWLMQMDAKLDRILEEMDLDDEEEAD
jgi:hypothetical protein